MRPIQALALLATFLSTGACTLEPDSVFEPGVYEPETGVGEVGDAASDGVVHPVGADQVSGEPPTIALPPGVLGGPSDGEALIAAGRDEAVSACVDRCDGDYRQHGTLPQEWCLCRSNDAGKRCESRGDCEGDCLFVGLHDDNGDGFAIPYGECGEFEQQFGCFGYLPDESPGLVAVDSYASPAICVD